MKSAGYSTCLRARSPGTKHSDAPCATTPCSHCGRRRPPLQLRPNGSVALGHLETRQMIVPPQNDSSFSGLGCTELPELKSRGTVLVLTAAMWGESNTHR